MVRDRVRARARALYLCLCMYCFTFAHLPPLHYSKPLFWLLLSSWLLYWNVLNGNGNGWQAGLSEAELELRRASLCLCCHLLLLLLSTYLLEATGKTWLDCGIDIQLSLCLWLSTSQDCLTLTCIHDSDSWWRQYQYLSVAVAKEWFLRC